VAGVSLQLRRSGPFIGMAGMATTLFLYGWSAAVLRDVASLVLLPAIWLLLFVLAARWFSRHPYRVLAMPFIATAVWFAAMLS